jgi:L,D-transpeptidase YbiS
MQPIPRKIQVSVPNQQLRLLSGGEVEAVFPVSTSRFGTGSEEGSFRTPVGRFRIAERIGHGEPLGRIFQSREAVGQWEPDSVTAEDLILTRILWLEGLDEANANTKQRFIYIHGTNAEESIGQPASCGCVRMRNEDVATLFALVEEGMEVEILI